MMDVRKVRENLGRIKIYYLKGESLRALGAALIAVKELVRGGTALPMELRSLVREGVQFLSRDDAIKRFLPTPLSYQPGQERALFFTLASTYKLMDEDSRHEDHNTALERKHRLDQSLNSGQKLLGQGKISEAEESFQEALKNYRDEHRIFLLIGRWLLDAGQPRRAVPYLKSSTELEPELAEAQQLYESALRAREEASR